MWVKKSNKSGLQLMSPYILRKWWKAYKWEGVGICSYLLVNFWYTRIAANQSSISALLTNRVGDCFLTIGMFAILWSLGSIDYATVFSLAPYISENIITIIGICLLIGAMAKSSQLGLHVWLPLAMEGPTPVSALIHASEFWLLTIVYKNQIPGKP
jgi:NADH-ubiquinone oxidoreductase chain 5